MGAVDEGPVEDLIGSPLNVAAGKGGFEFATARGVFRQGQLLVAVPEELDVAGGDALAGGHSDDGLEEGFGDDRPRSVVDGN